MSPYFKIIVITIGCILGLEIYKNKTTNYNKIVYANQNNYSEQTEKDKQKEKLLKFTLKVMDMHPSVKLSESQKEFKANKVVSFVMDQITGGEAAQEQFISMIKLESNFDNNLKSSVGAIGIAQIMKETFNRNAEDCDLDVKPEDIYNEDINLYFGACYYQELLDDPNNENNPRLASLNYNGGPKVVEKFKKLGDINSESASYALKAERVTELANQ
jgi:hypothetical protein